MKINKKKDFRLCLKTAILCKDGFSNRELAELKSAWRSGKNSINITKGIFEKI